MQQLNAVCRQTLVALASRVPLLFGGLEATGHATGQVVFVDLDSTHRQVYGYRKQGAAVGRLKGKKTLHPLIDDVHPDQPAGGRRGPSAAR